ncbi:hypothetical protein MMC09_000382 [Bachmanniomyces sp. S44760]|nr:hypothetical protein [Bachmanniomyces sp. S44760]
MNIILVDWDSSKLEKAKTSFKEGDENHWVKSFVVDVGKEEDWKVLKGKLEDEDEDEDVKGIDFLMLNAGVGGPTGGWEDVGYFKRIMDTNLFGVINGIASFLPVVQGQDHHTAIVITGSKQGITNPPGNPAYNASKAAIKTLAEHLSYDLRATTTSVHLLVPGWTHTGLTGAGTISEKPAGSWAPEQVATYLEQKMSEDVFYVICPDNDVTVNKDRKRMFWSVGDIVNERPPCSRWREGWREKADDWMMRQDV